MNALLTDPGTRQAAQALLLPLYLIWLSVWDIRRGQLPLSLLAAGGGAGLLLRIADLIAGEETAALCGAYLPGTAAGLFLLAAARISKEEIGYGDGICFCTLALWLPWGDLLTLLLTALALCGIPGAIIALIRKTKKIALPFMPFVAAAYLLLVLLGA